MKPISEPCATCWPSCTYHTMRLATAPAICRNRISTPLAAFKTVVVRSFSVLDLGCQATKYFPLWYLKYCTTPATGFQLMWTLSGDIKMETCRRGPLKYSLSTTSSITTTLPSQGAMTWLGLSGALRTGLRKNCRIMRKKTTLNSSQMAEIQVFSVRNRWSNKLEISTIRAVVAIIP